MSANDRDVSVGPPSTLVGAILEARDALRREFDGFRHLLRQREVSPTFSPVVESRPAAEAAAGPEPAPRRPMVVASETAPAPRADGPPHAPVDARQRLDALARLLDQRARPHDPASSPPSGEPGP